MNVMSRTKIFRNHLVFLCGGRKLRAAKKVIDMTTALCKSRPVHAVLWMVRIGARLTCAVESMF